MPKLSIITVNLNNAKGLQKTIESVVSQIFIGYEYIIIDGGSTDGSVDIIKKYAGKITYWISEPDKGIYNAMNKGINVAKGEYCLFLNSGDWLINQKILQEVFDLGFNEDIVYGDLLIDEDWVKKYPENLDLAYFIKDTLPHPGSFIKKSIFDRIGKYDENLKIVADWKFFIRAIIQNNSTYRYITKIIANFNLDGISANNYLLVKQERKTVLQENIDLIITDYLEINNKLKKYQNSRLIQLVKKFQTSKLYKNFKN